ncbi:MAG TPA: 4'-phosphopantetheinyl transferase superfamily protein [Bacteroidales bacterium]|nr:4'-phosphopantetheinyl transferase superfamily protein [Bacteroidales bacterium]HOR10689.1 4'-phosphopantetheinyl transferase superfamily protein [Bacteroidales bacterium]HPK39343.1 4'-phosphopantetheinyl transferase superfamily protein [Bacteroidales bacterium]
MIYLLAQIDTLPESFPETCTTFMPPERTRKMMGYSRIQDRKLCAAAYVLLIYALKKEKLFTRLPLFAYGPCNKPGLSNYPDLHFNISHCEGVVVCALSQTPVGIDIEKVMPYDDELARYICNPVEYQWINAISGQNALRLTEMWTRKESGVKCLGTGIDCHPATMESGQSRVMHAKIKNDLYIISIRKCSK